MNKDLLVQIFVPKRNGEGCIATGYPVASGLILTARHMLHPEDRDEDKPIEVRWYHQAAPARAWRPIGSIAWEDEALDVALLCCAFPEGLRDWGVPSTDPPRDTMRWVSEGFARAGRKEDGNRRPVGLQGRAYSMAEAAQEFELGVDDPTSLADGWRGLSGCPVFVDQKILGVVKTCPANFDARRLKATPMWRLHEHPGFRKHLGYPERERQLREMLDAVAGLLAPCPKATEALVGELSGNGGRIDAGKRPEDLADALMRLRFEDLLPKLNRIHDALCRDAKNTASADATAVEELSARLLPVIYDAAVIEGTRTRVTGGQVALMSLPSATRTLAEIIMAGTDRRPSEFRPAAGELDFPLGLLALPDPPESGIDAGHESFLRNWHVQMIEKFASPEDRGRYRDQPEELIQRAADELNHQLESYSKRFYYFAVLPPDEPARLAWRALFGELKRLYPPIAFVTLTDARDMERNEQRQLRPLRDMLFRAKAPNHP